MKNIYLIFLIFIIIGCSNTKVTSDFGSLNPNDQTTKFILRKFQVEEANKNIIYFTSGFENEDLQIVVDNIVLYNDKISTIDQLSLAYVQVITNDKPIIIKFNEIKLSLDYKKLRNYKFVYILKIEKKYLIEYSNKSKNFF